MLHRQSARPARRPDPVALARLARPAAARLPASAPVSAPAKSEAAPVTLAGEAAARRYFEARFAELDPASETLLVAHVDEFARCIHLSAHDGTADGADLPLRAILLDAAARGSKGLVLAHNHPSGDATPSSADRQATRRLAHAAEAIDLTLLDHLVFGGGDCASFRRMGLL